MRVASQAKRHSLEKTTEVAFCPAGQILYSRDFSRFSEEFLVYAVVGFERVTFRP